MLQVGSRMQLLPRECDTCLLQGCRDSVCSLAPAQAHCSQKENVLMPPAFPIDIFAGSPETFLRVLQCLTLPSSARFDQHYDIIVPVAHAQPELGLPCAQVPAVRPCPYGTFPHALRLLWQQLGLLYSTVRLDPDRSF